MAVTCDPPLPPSPSLIHTHLPGALDITEEVGAAVGIPHVAKIWEEVHRSHQLNRRVTRPSRSQTQTPIIEEPEEEEGQCELVSSPSSPLRFVLLTCAWYVPGGRSAD